MSFYGEADIGFPNLGITIKNLPVGIDIFGFQIAFYGIVMAISFLTAFFVIEKQIKRLKLDEELYIEMAFFVVLAAVVGARLYYVVFSFDSFKDNLLQIFNLRTGGMAIYGDILGAALVAYAFCRIKRCKFGEMADLSIKGLLIGQIIGRIGNFFNKEAFGSYTDSIFAMRLPIDAVNSDYSLSIAELTTKYSLRPQALAQIAEQLENIVIVDGTAFIQAHPTFLYEMAWNILLLFIIYQIDKHKKYDGELWGLYLLGYGIGRILIEGIRTDSLYIMNSSIRVSELLSLVIVIGAGIYLGYKYYTYEIVQRKETKQH